MSKEQGLFEVDGNYYTLKFNMNKIKQIETMLNISFMDELQKSNGVISFRLLEALFAVGLYDVNEEKAIKGQKALNIYEQLLKDVGFSNVIAVTIGKVQEDLAFLFPEN